MTIRKSSGGAMLLLCAGAGVAVLTLVAVVTLLNGGEKLDPEEYNALAEVHKARVYLRPADTPLGPTDEGPSAPYYQEAHAGVEALKEASRDPDVHQRVGAALLTLKGMPLEEAEPAPESLSPICASLGVNAGDELSAHLDEETCRWIKARRPLSAKLLEGATRRDARSSMAVWEPWAVEAPNGLRNLIPFIELSKVGVIDAHLVGQREGRGEELRRLLLLSRACQDLSQGGSLLSTMVGVACGEQVHDRLSALLVQDAFDAEQLKTLIEELLLQHAIRAQPGAITEGEVLMMAPMLMEEREALNSPPTALSDSMFSGGNVFERFVARNTAGEMLKFWHQYLQAQALPTFHERIAQYDVLEDNIQNAFNPLAALSVPALDRYEGRLLAHQTHRAMLISAAALRRGQRLKRPFALTRAGLAAAAGLDPENPAHLPPLDLLMNAPLLLEEAPAEGSPSNPPMGGVTLKSAALDDPDLQYYLQDEAVEMRLTLELPQVTPAPMP